LFSLLIFDLDGTLIDSRKDIALSVNLTLRDLGRPPLSDETIYSYVGNGVTRLVTDSTGSSDPAALARALEIFDTHYLAHLTDQTRLYPGMIDVLHHYRERRKILVTNKRAKFTRKIMENLGVADQFELLVSGDEIGPMKPDPGMIFYALKQSGLSAREAIVIGDMNNDINAARAAGVASCAVGYGMGDIEQLRDTADFFADTVQDLITLSL
jgi:phosphoglycolate phosphatase